MLRKIAYGVAVFAIVAGVGYGLVRTGIAHSLYETTVVDPQIAAQDGQVAAHSVNRLSATETAIKFADEVYPWDFSTSPTGQLLPQDEALWIVGARQASALATPALASGWVGKGLHSGWINVVGQGGEVAFNKAQPWQIADVETTKSGHVLVWVQYLDHDFNSGGKPAGDGYSYALLYLQHTSLGWKIYNDVPLNSGANQLFHEFRAEYVGGPFHK